MKPRCSIRDTERTDGAQFCEKSGAPVSTAPHKNRQLSPLRRILLPVLVFLLAFAIFRLLRPNPSWVEETACAKITSVVYKTYGEIPDCTAQILAQSGKRRYLVAVRFHLPDLDWRGSHACLVYGVDSDTSYVERMTTEMSYDYDYAQHLAELKALWGLQ